MKFHPVFIGTVAFTISVGAHWLCRSSRAQERVPIKCSVDAELNDPVFGSRLESAIAGLERRLELLEARRTIMEAQSAAASSLSAASAQLAQEQSELSDEEDGESATAQNADIDKRWESEPRDRSWAGSTENKIREALAVSTEESEMKMFGEIACRTSLCRLQLPITSQEGTILSISTTALPTHVRGIRSIRFDTERKDSNGKPIVTYTLFRRGYPTDD